LITVECDIFVHARLHWFCVCRHYTKAAESRFHIFTLTLSPRFLYHYCFSSAGRGNGRGAMPFLMSFALEHEIVTFAWIDNASVQFPLNIYATKGLTQFILRFPDGAFNADRVSALPSPVACEQHPVSATQSCLSPRGQ